MCCVVWLYLKFDFNIDYVAFTLSIARAKWVTQLYWIKNIRDINSINYALCFYYVGVTISSRTYNIMKYKISFLT